MPPVPTERVPTAPNVLMVVDELKPPTARRVIPPPTVVLSSGSKKSVLICEFSTCPVMLTVPMPAKADRVELVSVGAVNVPIVPPLIGMPETEE